MGFVDDDGKIALTMLVADLIQDKREFLDGGDDDLLTAFDEPAQIAGMLGVPHSGAHLGILLDRVPDLFVQHAPVGDDDNRIKDVLIVFPQADQLVGQPGDGVALAAAG